MQELRWSRGLENQIVRPTATQIDILLCETALENSAESGVERLRILVRRSYQVPTRCHFVVKLYLQLSIMCIYSPVVPDGCSPDLWGELF
jgi:hypothetical protein